MASSRLSGLEIKTKSIEQTLLPFVNQISVLVNHKERPVRNARIRDALRRVGKEVQIAVDRFVTIGEQVAEDYPQIHEEMTAACREAHEAGYSIFQVTSDRFATPDSSPPVACHSPNSRLAEEKSRLSLLREKQAVLRAARFLLQSVTKVLLMADKVLVYQILDARDRLNYTLVSLSEATTFSEFVELFSQYGAEMVQLAHLSGERLADLKDDKRRTQLASARCVLEKTTTLLLTSSKLYLRHPECEESRIARDIVYCRMQDALLLLSYAVTDGELAPETTADGNALDDPPQGMDQPSRNPAHYIPAIEDAVTLVNSLQHLEDAIDMIRISDEPLTTSASRSSIMLALKGIEESVLDFTECNDVPQQSRQQLITLSGKIRSSLSVITEQSANPDALTANTVNIELHKCQKLAQEMTKALQETALHHASETLTRLRRDEDEHLHEIRRSAMNASLQELDNACAMFITKGDGLREVTRMLKHAAQKYSLLAQADRIEGTLQALQKQIVYSAQVLVKHPTSKIARENLEVFFEAWTNAVKDVAALAAQSANASRESRAVRTGYMSLPRRGRHGAAPRIPKPQAVQLCLEDQSRLVHHGLEMKLLTSEMDAETEKWGASAAAAGGSGFYLPPLHENTVASQHPYRYAHANSAVFATPNDNPPHSAGDMYAGGGAASSLSSSTHHQHAPTLHSNSSVSAAIENGGGGNDIVSRAKSMSTLAFQMYLFTRGEGPLRTTQDLFIQAEHFAEEANKLFKVVRDFAVHVPAGVARAELMTNLDSVPPHVQRLLSSLKQPTVGKPATFNKVDAVIQETKHLMNAIAKVVTTCFICATKYDMDATVNIAAITAASARGRKNNTIGNNNSPSNNTVACKRQSQHQQQQQQLSSAQITNRINISKPINHQQSRMHAQRQPHTNTGQQTASLGSARLSSTSVIRDGNVSRFSSNVSRFADNIYNATPFVHAAADAQSGLLLQRRQQQQQHQHDWFRPTQSTLLDENGLKNENMPGAVYSTVARSSGRPRRQPESIVEQQQQVYANLHANISESYHYQFTADKLPLNFLYQQQHLIDNVVDSCCTINSSRSTKTTRSESYAKYAKDVDFMCQPTPVCNNLQDDDDVLSNKRFDNNNSHCAEAAAAMVSQLYRDLPTQITAMPPHARSPTTTRFVGDCDDWFGLDAAAVETHADTRQKCTHASGRSKVYSSDKFNICANAAAVEPPLSRFSGAGNAATTSRAAVLATSIDGDSGLGTREATIGSTSFSNLTGPTPSVSRDGSKVMQPVVVDAGPQLLPAKEGAREITDRETVIIHAAQVHQPPLRATNIFDSQPLTLRKTRP